MSRLRRPQILGLLLPLLLILLSQPSSSSGQSCPLPELARILGYAHLDRPLLLAEGIHTLLSATGRSTTVDEMQMRLSSLIGDRTGALIPREGSMTIAWVLTDAGVRSCVVLPEVKTIPYLRDCLDQCEKEQRTAEGVTFIAPAPVFKEFDGISEPLAALHAQLHPTDLTIYLSADLLRQWQEDAVEFLDDLGAPTLDGLLAHALGHKQVRTGETGLLFPTAVQDISSLSIPARVVGDALGQAEAVHFLADLGAEPPRVTLNIAARPDTALAQFLDQSRPKPNALVRFLPTNGAVRAAINVDGESVATLLDSLIAGLGTESAGNANQSALRAEAVEGLEGLRQPMALSLSSWSGAGPSVVFSTPKRIFPTAEGIRALLTTTRWFPRARGEGVAQVAPPGPQMMVPSAAGRKKPKPHDAVEVRHDAASFEKFPITAFFAAGAPSDATTDQALLVACLTGPVLVLTPQFDELMGAVNRILHLAVRSEALLSQETFLDGAHLYADVRPTDQTAMSWSQSDVLQLMARFGEGRAQVAASLPPAAFGGVFRVNP